MTAPSVPLDGLDELWFQIAGTRCNLACSHCFVSCSPTNRAFGFLDKETVFAFLEEGARRGVKEFYFTGGEPFLHRDLPEILERTLTLGPATVLTNGTAFTEAALARLRRAEETSRYSLELRLSLDGFTPETNDPVRGAGTFDRIVRGLRLALDYGFLPIVTAAVTNDADDPARLYDGFVALLRGLGCRQPRVKILPTLRLGAETTRQRGYAAEERVTPEMLEGFDLGQLLCRRGRIVTDRGVACCPILIEAPGAHFGPTLADADRPASLGHAACYTCWQYGALCSNASSRGRDA